MASAMIERAEFPVQRKRTLKGRPVTQASRATCRRGRRSGCSLRNAAGLGMGHAGVILAGAIAVFRAFAGRVEGLPGNAGRIIDPGFLRLGITTGGLPLL